MTGSPLLTRMLTCAVLCSASVAIADEQPPLPQHPLVYVHHSDAERKNYDIWWMCSDGTQQASLVAEPGHQAQFAISPDGNTIAWVSREEGVPSIWKRAFTGRKAEQLVPNASGPAFSPDGRHLAFFSTRDASKPELYLLDLDSGESRRLTTNEFHDSGASWAPDAKSLVLTRFLPGDGQRGGSGEVIRISLSDGSEQQLTTLGGYNGGLCHSPDGGSLAFHHVDDNGVELWTMRADGTKAKAITKTFVDEYSPAWSPDGNWIAYTAGTQNDGRGTFDLWLIRPDGSGARLINSAANTQMSPAWRTGKHRCR